MLLFPLHHIWKSKSKLLKGLLFRAHHTQPRATFSSALLQLESGTLSPNYWMLTYFPV